WLRPNARWQIPGVGFDRRLKRGCDPQRVLVRQSSLAPSQKADHPRRALHGLTLCIVEDGSGLLLSCSQMYSCPYFNIDRTIVLLARSTVHDSGRVHVEATKA